MSLEQLLRFKDLRRLGVVSSWPQLRYMQETTAFQQVCCWDRTPALGALRKSRHGSPIVRLSHHHMSWSVRKNRCARGEPRDRLPKNQGPARLADAARKKM